MSNNIRGPGQKLISVPMNEKFITKIDASLPKVGYSDRSSFIRDAIVEKLQGAGIDISYELSLAPSRTGKGGRPPLRREEEPVTKAGRKPATKPKTKFRLPGGAHPAASFGRNYTAA